MRSRILQQGYLLFVFAMTALSTPAGAAECPPGRVVQKVVESEDSTQTFCKCDVGHIPRGRACIRKMPEVDPAFFVSAEHASFVRAELERLRAKRAKIAAQLAKLEQLRSEQDRYLQEMGLMREQVMYDGLSDMLSVVSSKVVLDRIPGLSPADARELTAGLRLMKTVIDAVAMEQAGPDRDRARRKALDASKTALGTIATLTIPDSYKDAFKKTIDATLESIKASDANWKAVDAPMRARVVKALDGMAAITGALVPPVGVARSGINAAGNAIVYWHIQNDKESIVEALVSSQRAKLAYDNRLSATDEMIRFYEVEVRKAGN
jgi:uncharacterized protein YigA (DUF484 family)